MSYFKPKAWAEIDISALLDNYHNINGVIGNSKQICVVKADCYGHGTAGVIPALCEAGCDFFAVSSLSEAVELRQYTDADILILGYTSPCDIPYVIESDITQTVFSHEYAASVLEYIPEGKRLKTHIKLDTGMNRIGYPVEDMGTVLHDCGNPKLDLRGMFTHFATSDEKKLDKAYRQLEMFSEAKKYLADHGVKVEMYHTSNSAAIFRMSDSIFDAVRSGICLYGCLPSDEIGANMLTPVMTLKCLVAHIHTLKKGQSISYGGEYTADADRVVATLTAGYADGLPRACKNCSIGINGTMYSIIGRICMDQCMVDITGASDIKCGDEAVIFGKGGMSADEMAEKAGTIGYELMCGINKRVERVYLK